jgi:hypothetical protein
MGSLSNFEIEDVAKHYNLPLIDCCMKDELNKLQNGFYIINLESSNQGDGTHWTTLIVQPDLAIFCDSFGAPPSTEIINFVKQRKGMHLAFSNEIIQDMQSSDCGYFCLYLCYYIKKHHREKGLAQLVESFTKLFKDNTKYNDGILRQLFKQIPDKNPPDAIIKLLRQKS